MATGLNRYLLIISLFLPNDLLDMIFPCFYVAQERNHP